MSNDQNGSDADLREARAAALNYLARREHSCQELRDKLLRRGIAEAVADPVVSQLRDENLVSDVRYAEAYTRARVGRLFGPLRIRSELRQRGIDDRVLEEALQPFSDQWQAMADDWAERKGVVVELDRKEQARIYRSGTNRGFTHEHMMRAIDRLKRGD